VPEIGSVGASGDLIPLSYTARVLRGEGKVKVDGRTMSARSALKKAGLQPIQPTSRDVLGLVNGTSFMTAFALHALARLERLIDLAEQITGWAYRLLGCPLAALDPRLHMARGHVGQTLSARNILSHATKNGAAEQSERPLQEIYSLRCAPQILGACRDQLIYATTLIEREINGANDNPLTFTATEGSPSAVLHGGNFQGQQIAFASDVINAAATQTAVLAERQLDLILNPQHNGGAPLLLAWKPGPCSGLAGVQICATSLVAEMRHHQHPAATLSIPTNGGNQDVVSMGTTAARHAYHQMPRLAGVLSILSLGLHRLNDLRSCGRAVGQQSQVPEFAQSLPRFKEDRPLDDAVTKLTHQFLDGTCNQPR
jgi:histidine ammonia-lyase/tyrosine ammonia-lyase